MDIDNAASRSREYLGNHELPPKLHSQANDPEAADPDALQAADEARSLNRSLAQIPNSLDTVANEIGTPTPKYSSARGQIAFGLMDALGRLLWWYTWRLKEAFGGLSRTLRTQNQQQSRINELILDAQAQSIRQVRSLGARVDAAARDITSNVADIERTIRQIQIETQPLQTAISDAQGEVRALVGATDLHARKFDELRAELLAKHEAVCASIENQAAAREKIEAEVRRLQSEAESMRSKETELSRYNRYLRSELTAQQARVSLLARGGKGQTPEPPAGGSEPSTLDGLYVAFEDAFRGPRDEIKRRQAAYLPLLAERPHLHPHPIIDLGCGRGEWLEIVRDHGFQGRGADVNQAMIDACRELGLQVEKSDGLAYLKALPDSSAAAVTAFHVVEHIPFESVIELIDQSLRVLTPGGILILETPNPANVTVGSHHFYMDPTHRKPIPSPMLRFFVEARGFTDAHVRELHPDDEALRLAETSPVASRFNEAFYGPRDYAVIGVKPLPV
jgi:O-antigen chain-terminating methyltransferase